MRDLKTTDGADIGGGAGSAQDAGPAAVDASLAASAPETPDWWDGFARVVEDPRVSTYDFLKDSVLDSLELQGANGVGEFFGKAQKKAFKELLSLTDLKELRKTISRMEGNQLLFDLRTRVVMQCAGKLIDTFLSAKDEYEADLAKRKAKGMRHPSEAEQKEQIKRIVEKKLGEPDVAEKVEQMAQALTGKDKDEIKQTLDEAAKQLRGRRSLSKIANDVFGISKRYFTLDNMATVGIVALPLITWQYRWALAAVLGAYAARLSVYHGGKALLAQFRGDSDGAREQGQKAFTALKAAGGNALAIGLTPLVGRLPKVFAGFATFAATYGYNTAIDVSQYLLRKKEQVEESKVGQSTKSGVKKAWQWTKKFFTENQDKLVVLTAGAVKAKVPVRLADDFEKASKRMPLTKATRLATGVWNVGVALARRFNRVARGVAGLSVAPLPDYSQTQKEFSAAAQGAPTEVVVAEPVAVVGNEVAPRIDGPV